MREFKRQQEARLNIIAELYKRGYTYREIQKEVSARLDLSHYSLRTVHNDIMLLLEDWRQTRIENLDLTLQLELQRLDDIVREAWTAWDKSKTDYTKQRDTMRGVPDEDSDKGQGVLPVQYGSSKENVVGNGDPRYLEQIQRALAERRKLLGLYPPEKKEVSGELSFLNLLMESSNVDS